MSSELFKPAGKKGEAEKNKGEERVNQMKLYPQGGLMVIHGNGLSDKEQGHEIKGKEETRQDQAQPTVRSEIKETVRNLKVRLDREEKEINVDPEDKGRSVPSREGR